MDRAVKLINDFATKYGTYPDAGQMPSPTFWALASEYGYKPDAYVPSIYVYGVPLTETTASSGPIEVFCHAPLSHISLAEEEDNEQSKTKVNLGSAHKCSFDGCEYVEMGFVHSYLACKHCDKPKPKEVQFPDWVLPW
jgi:hypothetical protein